MTSPDPESLLRHALKREAGPTPQCLDDETIAALAEGTADDVARRAALLHLAECPRCRTAVASVARALADPSVAREVARVPRTWRRVLTIAIPTAAAAVVLLVASPRGGDDGSSPHRAPTITAVSSPVLVSPVGIVADAEALRWHGVSGADRYRVTLFDDAGAVLYETQTADTTVAPPETVRLEAGRSYLWTVEARIGWGRWSASQLVEFSVR
jgi:hypothetical protein